MARVKITYLKYIGHSLTIRGLLFIFCLLDYSEIFGFLLSCLLSFLLSPLNIFRKSPLSVFCLESKRANASNLYFVTVVAVDTIAVVFGGGGRGKKKRLWGKTTAASLILFFRRKAPVTLRQCSAPKANPGVPGC